MCRAIIAIGPDIHGAAIAELSIAGLFFDTVDLEIAEFGVRALPADHHSPTIWKVHDSTSHDVLQLFPEL